MNYLSNLHLTNSTAILIAIQYSVTIKRHSSYAGKQIFLLLRSCRFESFSRGFKHKVLRPYTDLRVSSDEVAYLSGRLISGAGS